jgi:hypothetical protein
MYESIAIQDAFYLLQYNRRVQSIHTASAIYAAAAIKTLAFFWWLNDGSFVE